MFWRTFTTTYRYFISSMYLLICTLTHPHTCTFFWNIKSVFLFSLAMQRTEISTFSKNFSKWKWLPLTEAVLKKVYGMIWKIFLLVSYVLLRKLMFLFVNVWLYSDDKCKKVKIQFFRCTIHHSFIRINIRLSAKLYLICSAQAFIVQWTEIHFLEKLL